MNIVANDVPPLRGHRRFEYRCGSCGNIFEHKDDLLAKQVRFMTLGRKYRTLKTRIVDWLCVPCAEADPAWKDGPSAIEARTVREGTDGQAPE